MNRDLVLTCFLFAVALAAANSTHRARVMLGGIAAAVLLRWLLNRWKD
ncbi:hypothetical protein [Mitsuaria sp. GD03876]|nr:hypothetical protein [Mitsuaria sp. GD03876]MDH0866228.1 hypothetical protein [Mitsuaria sp. GD03876]